MPMSEQNVLEYQPDQWNPYPQVKPPESGYYIVTIRAGSNGTASIHDVYLKKFDCWAVCEKDVLAFRAFPSPYKPEKSE